MSGEVEMPARQSEARDLVHKVVDTSIGLPGFIIRYIVLLLVAAFTDPVIFSMVVAAVAVGFAASLPIGVAAFFGLYVIARVFGEVANAIGYSGRNLSGAVMQHVNAVSYRPTPNEADYLPAGQEVPLGVGVLPRT